MMFCCGHVETQTRTSWLVLQMCFCPHVKASRVEFVAELVLYWYLYSYVISRHSLTTYIYSSCSTQHYVYTYVCIYLPAYLPTYHLPTTYLPTYLLFSLSLVFLCLQCTVYDTRIRIFCLTCKCIFVWFSCFRLDRKQFIPMKHENNPSAQTTTSWRCFEQCILWKLP